MLDIIAKRLANPNDNPHIPEGWLKCRVEGVFINESSAKEAEGKIKDVMKSIVSYDPERKWPSEDEWKKILPQWLLSNFHEYTEQELAQYEKDKISLGWDYESWLDSIKERVWEWWHSERQGESIIFTLIVDGWPYSIKAFEHIVKSSGAESVEEKES